MKDYYGPKDAWDIFYVAQEFDFDDIVLVSDNAENWIKVKFVGFIPGEEHPFAVVDTEADTSKYFSSSKYRYVKKLVAENANKCTFCNEIDKSIEKILSGLLEIKQRGFLNV